MQAGLSEAQVDNVRDYATSDLYSARERLALEYADRITLSDQDVDEEFFERLRAEFTTPPAVVQLTAVIAFENFRSKFNHALGVESNGVCLLKT